jgi:2-oxoglutarate/2-oxoacid ferredoxin oxidoreductase subunit beta
VDDALDAALESPADLVPMRREITAASSAGAVSAVAMHDGSVLRFRAVDEGYDPADRDRAYAHVRALQARGEIATGLLYADPGPSSSMHHTLGTAETPLVELPYDALCPGAASLDELMAELR